MKYHFSTLVVVTVVIQIKESFGRNHSYIKEINTLFV